MIKRFESIITDTEYYDETIKICSIIKSHFSKIATAIWIYPSDTYYLPEYDEYRIYQYSDKYDFLKSTHSINDYISSDKFEKKLNYNKSDEEIPILYSYYFETYRKSYEKPVIKLISYVNNDDADICYDYDKEAFYNNVRMEFNEEIKKLGYIFYNIDGGYVILKDTLKK